MTGDSSQKLLPRQLPAGGFAEHPGGGLRPDASAWAALALMRLGTEPAAAGRACRLLAGLQLPDGRVPANPAFPSAWWPTPIAVLAWQAAGEFGPPRDLAVRFLLATSGRHWNRRDGSPSSHDPSLKGWAWVEDTHSWVEPTALTLLALDAAGFGRHARSVEARRLLLDRQLANGGWNYGNVKVFGRELHPLAETTGMALQALRGHVPREAVGASLDYLEKAMPTLRTPLSLGWSLLGLSAWDRRPAAARELIDTCLALQEAAGPYPTSGLSVLLLAGAGNEGVKP